MRLQSGFIAEHIEFLRQYRRRFETTGAVAPSSRFLAQALTRPFQQRRAPARILEVGPGTGAVTRRLVRLLSTDDRLDLVELNDRFVDVLKRRFADDPSFRFAAARTSIHHCPIQEFPGENTYDYIVSGLPLNNFAPTLVREILEALFRLLAPNGVLSYFEYMYMRPLRRLVSDPAGRARLHDLESVLQEYLATHRVGRDWVFLNLPPAWVQHLRQEPTVNHLPAPGCEALPVP